MFIDGKSVLEVKGLVFCTTEDGELEQGTESRVHGMHFQTFFGGEQVVCTLQRPFFRLS